MTEEKKQKLGQITVRRRTTKSTEERKTRTQRKPAYKNIY